MAMHRRTAALAVTALLALPAVTACSALDTALDCANTAVAVSEAANDLQQAISNAGENPQDAQKALDEIEQALKDIGDKSDNADIEKAVNDISTGVANARKAINDGNANPDLSGITDGVNELSKVCTP
ncbi:hypothetical protein LG634_20675 [Streptomyces bambusae]|uniref:hypothetical protein n=1 Tax=Streptomyces bambusae TaxID=1550616 RepID=UPI001CFD8080|nr:hypothetical protein [Streptomyces bambusae]MCB5167246.1 hypothetical protein [Streptomyces bambusae]